MDDALTTAIQALHNSQARMNTISHNVANTATPGFKRSVPLIRPFAQTMSEAASTAVLQPAAPRFELGVDASAALPVHTGQPLDLLVEGDAYLELTGSHGVGYARSGSFRLDPSGRMLNTQGAALQGTNGGLALSGDPVSIKADGTLMQNGRTVGALKLVTLPKVALTKGDDGLLRPAASAGGAAVAAADGRATVRTGYLEGSNVSTVRETVMLLETQRNFEALTRLMSAYDEQIGAALQKLGEF